MCNTNESISLKSLKLKIYNEAKKENKEERRPLFRRGQLATDSERHSPSSIKLGAKLGPSLYCGTVEQQRFLLATLTLDIGKARVRGNGNVVAKKRCRCQKQMQWIPSLHLVALRCANAALCSCWLEISHFFSFQCPLHFRSRFSIITSSNMYDNIKKHSSRYKTSLLWRLAGFTSQIVLEDNVLSNSDW